jgi:hypothetical protein
MLRQTPNAVYVDKTKFIYELTRTYSYVFLSRPRLMGKTMLCSTMQCYFEGRKELFKGLAIEQLETEWTQYPVLHFSLGVVKSTEPKNVESNLARLLRRYEAIYGRDPESDTLSGRMADLIERAYAQSGRRVVVLIDEYDAPILEVLHDKHKREKVRELLREFFSPLKDCDPYLRFVFMTGISTYVPMYWDCVLNNMIHLSTSSKAATICGFTMQEVLDNFPSGIAQLAEEYKCTTEEAIAKLKEAYDGYRFSEEPETVLSPWDVLNAIKDKMISPYWANTGSWLQLYEIIKRYKEEGRFKLSDLERKCRISDMQDLPVELGATPLLYHTGYLTFKEGNDEIWGRHTKLGIPNESVRTGLMDCLSPLFAEELGSREK